MQVDSGKIFLIGMMGAGKSSVGLILSRILGLPFFDTDELIGVDVYFDNHTMDEFRIEEMNQIDKIIKKSDSCVISVGGGSIIMDKNRALISQHTCFFLKASIDNLINRIKLQNITRPLIKYLDSGDIDKKDFSKIYNERKDYYFNLANFIIDTDHLNPLKTAMDIKNKIINYEIIN